MNVRRAQKRIWLFVLLPAVTLYIGMRFWAQFRHVDVFVSREAPVPAELAARLPMDEMKIHRTMTIDTPYDNATNKVLSIAEIRRIRSAISWSRGMMPFIDSIIIETPTNVTARHFTRRFMTEYMLVKRNGEWIVDFSSRGELER